MLAYDIPPEFVDLVFAEVKKVRARTDVLQGTVCNIIKVLLCKPFNVCRVSCEGKKYERELIRVPFDLGCQV